MDAATLLFWFICWSIFSLEYLSWWDWDTYNWEEVANGTNDVVS